MIFSGLSVSGLPAFSQTIGTTEKADDTVRGSKAGRLSAGTDVVANERITANSTGMGHFLFNDGTKMVVGPGTRLKLDETIYNPNQSSFNKFAIDSSAGALRFISGESRSNSYEIETPTGTLGVRGTAFDLRHYRGRTYVMLVEGEVTFCSRTNSCETLRRKCSFVVASPTGRVSDPVLPRNSQFEEIDMERYFPLIFDQSPILPSYRLNVSKCAAAAQFTGVNEPSSGDAGFGGTTPDSDTDPEPDPEPDPEGGDDDGTPGRGD